jgi:hypothetical protein
MIAEAFQTSYEDTQIQPGVKYLYWVSALEHVKAASPLSKPVLGWARKIKSSNQHWGLFPASH